jgi:hypothetical protein
LLTFVGAMREADGDMVEALSLIGSLSLASLVMLLVAVILASVLAAAVQNHVVRLLEGYWGSNRLTIVLATAQMRRHRAARDRLRARLVALEREAFTVARRSMSVSGIPEHVLQRIEEVVLKGRPPATAEHQHTPEAVDWRSYAPPDLEYASQQIVSALAAYPRAQNAILPTRLGNVLQAAEEGVRDVMKGGSFEDVVARELGDLPVEVQIQFDTYISRLDFYALLVVAFTMAAVVSVPVLAPLGLLDAFGLPALLVLFAAACYGAAVANARAYGYVLRTIAASWRSQLRTGR